VSKGQEVLGTVQSEGTDPAVVGEVEALEVCVEQVALQGEGVCHFAQEGGEF